MRSRVTAAGGRSPGSRVAALDRLPKSLSALSGMFGRKLAAYSCGGSRGIAPKPAHRVPYCSLAGTTKVQAGRGYVSRQVVPQRPPGHPAAAQRGVQPFGVGLSMAKCWNQDSRCPAIIRPINREARKLKVMPFPP